MADPNNPNPPSPPNPPAPDATPAVTPPAPAGAGASPPAATPPAPAPGPETPPRTRDWKDDRIDTLTARLREAQRQAAPPAPVAPPSPAAIPEAEINSRAVNIAAQIRFNEECERVAADGRKQFQDFDDKVKELTRVVTPGAEGQYATLVAAAIRTGDAARVLHQLGSDLKLAQRMLGMDPLSMTAELTRMAVGASPPRMEISNAPSPITPVSVRASGIQDARPDDPTTGDGLTIAEWMKRRNEQVKNQSTRGNRFR